MKTVIRLLLTCSDYHWMWLAAFFVFLSMLHFIETTGFDNEEQPMSLANIRLSGWSFWRANVSKL